MREKITKPLNLSKDEVIKYYKLIIYELENNVSYIIFRKLKVNSGYCIWLPNGTCHIELDPRDEVLPVLIHELLHAVFPDYDEDQVLALEFTLTMRLSIRQYRKLWELAIGKMRNKKSLLS